MDLYQSIMEMDRPFFIAEAGVNHNGNIDLAKQLVDAAVMAGVDCVKFQTFKTKSVVTSKADMAEYQKTNTGNEESQQDMIKKLELSLDETAELKQYCDEQGIMFMTTPHSSDVVDFVDPLVPAYKTGSGDLTNLPFLRDLARRGKPIFLSTGMATLEEVGVAIQAIYAEGNKQLFVLLY